MPFPQGLVPISARNTAAFGDILLIMVRYPQVAQREEIGKLHGHPDGDLLRDQIREETQRSWHF